LKAAKPLAATKSAAKTTPRMIPRNLSAAAASPSCPFRQFPQAPTTAATGQ
jgi:hypothetical protein